MVAILPALKPGQVSTPRIAVRDHSIQSLRGLAVILMVAGHVIGHTATRGMRVPDDSAWRFFYLALADVRLPLFTVLSGYVYAMRPIRAYSDVPGLLRAKTRRLLFPLVTIGSVLMISEITMPGTNERPDLPASSGASSSSATSTSGSCSRYF